jgi:hypothetical protein
MKDALEMAVLTTVSHPNIIQVYNCFTDMVEDAGRHCVCWVSVGVGVYTCANVAVALSMLHISRAACAAHCNCFTDMVQDAGALVCG